MISLTYSKLDIISSPSEIPRFRQCIPDIRSFTNMLNNVGDNESPCLTPLEVVKQSVCTSFNVLHDQGFQSADSIHAINLLTSGLFTVNTMWTD